MPVPALITFQRKEHMLSGGGSIAMWDTLLISAISGWHVAVGTKVERGKPDDVRRRITIHVAGRSYTYDDRDGAVEKALVDLFGDSLVIPAKKVNL